MPTQFREECWKNRSIAVVGNVAVAQITGVGKVLSSSVSPSRGKLAQASL
jgi:hypothetical protein